MLRLDVKVGQTVFLNKDQLTLLATGPEGSRLRFKAEGGMAREFFLDMGVKIPLTPEVTFLIPRHFGGQVPEARFLLAAPRSVNINLPRLERQRVEMGRDTLLNMSDEEILHYGADKATSVLEKVLLDRLGALL